MSFTLPPFLILTSSVMVFSTIMTMMSSNWLFLWAAMELNLLSFIPILMNSKKFQETEAAIKYFLAQALGSSMMLMSSMSLWFNSSIPGNMMLFLLIMSITLKLGMVPCHLWYPSVMASASWPSCLILSTWQKLAPLMILSFILSYSSSYMITVIASANALMGGLMGLNQTSLRSIMAYSSITHMGWMTSLLSIFKPMLTSSYFLMYALIITPIFMTFHLKSMSSSTTMSKVIMQSPTMQLILPILLLSLAGLPPLTGFIPKWLTIYSLSMNNQILCFVLISGAMMNTYYYLNIIFNVSMSFISNKKSMVSTHQVPQNNMTILTTMILLMFPIMFIM